MASSPIIKAKKVTVEYAIVDKDFMTYRVWPNGNMDFFSEDCNDWLYVDYLDHTDVREAGLKALKEST